MESYKYLLATAVLASLGMNAMAQATYTDKDGNEYQFKKHFYLDIQEVDSIHWARLSSRTYSLLIFRELLAINSLQFSDSVLR